MSSTERAGSHDVALSVGWGGWGAAPLATQEAGDAIRRSPRRMWTGGEGGDRICKRPFRAAPWPRPPQQPPPAPPPASGGSTRALALLDTLPLCVTPADVASQRLLGLCGTESRP